jgi:ABC-2 type transport system ATP-binding protein
MKTTCALRTRAITHQYGALPVLRGIDLQIENGEIRGLIGPNGSGKSTLIRVISGLLRPTTGQVEIAGIDLQLDPDAARLAFGLAPDPNLLPPRLSGRQCLLVYAATRGLLEVPPASELLAQRLGMTPWLDRPVATYSLGTRQKLAVLQAVLGHPPLLILDEVLNGLDPISAHELKLELRERAAHGSAILLATHGLEAAVELLHSADVLLDGRIHRHFDAQQLQVCRNAGSGAFETAVVAAMRGQEPTRSSA